MIDGIYHFPLRVVGHEAQDTWQPSSDLAAALTPDVMADLTHLGLDPEFSEILERHLSDMHTVIDTACDNTHITVSCHHEPQAEKGTKKVWHREIVISDQQRKLYKNVLEEKWLSLYEVSLPEEVADRLAVHWLFFEASADALGNSLYMQRNYGRYIPDHNGQSSHYRSELTVSRVMLAMLADVEGSEEHRPRIVRKEKEPRSEVLRRISSGLEADHAAFKRGVALIMLHNAILRSGAIESANRSRWIIKQLRDGYPQIGGSSSRISPLTEEEIMKRISMVEPSDTRAAIAAFVLGIEDELDD